MEIRQASLTEYRQAAALAVQVWEGNDLAAMEEEFVRFLQNDETAVFLAWDGDFAVGFAQCGLRRDYVEGTESSPVGYLEGIFVAEGYRRQGLAGQLLSACEAWCRQKGCTEMGSDCELGNQNSLAFHLNCGFLEANRIICFVKKL